MWPLHGTVLALEGREGGVHSASGEFPSARLVQAEKLELRYAGRARCGGITVHRPGRTSRRNRPGPLTASRCSLPLGGPSRATDTIQLRLDDDSVAALVAAASQPETTEQT